MLNIHKLTISFQGEDLFKDVSFRLQHGDKVGLIGKNGAGKSTLLRILAGEQEYDAGDIAHEKNASVGFLKQDIEFEEGRTVIEESYLAFEKLKSLEAKLEEIHVQMEQRDDYESSSYEELMVQLNEIQHEYELNGGYQYQGDTEKILMGLGFQRSDFNRQTNTFSGGWRMRIELAKLLLQKPDVLLLDEPTNHLDIESIIWLEQFLQNYPGAVMIVSHDRLFLDTVTNRTIEISLGRIYDYNKPYTKFMALREEIRVQQMAAHKNQQKQIENTEKLINRFRAKATKASMAQSLMKKTRQDGAHRGRGGR